MQNKPAIPVLILLLALFLALYFCASAAFQLTIDRSADSEPMNPMDSAVPSPICQFEALYPPQEFEGSLLGETIPLIIILFFFASSVENVFSNCSADCAWALRIARHSGSHPHRAPPYARTH